MRRLIGWEGPMGDLQPLPRSTDSSNFLQLQPVKHDVSRTASELVAGLSCDLPWYHVCSRQSLRKILPRFALACDVPQLDCSHVVFAAAGHCLEMVMTRSSRNIKRYRQDVHNQPSGYRKLAARYLPGRQADDHTPTQSNSCAFLQRAGDKSGITANVCLGLERMQKAHHGLYDTSYYTYHSHFKLPYLT